MLFLWDDLLTILPFIVLSVWNDPEYQNLRIFIVLAAVCGSKIGVATSGLFKNTLDYPIVIKSKY